MKRLVFIDSILAYILATLIILSLSGFMTYNLIATQNYLNIIAIVVPLLLFIPLYRRRVVVEHGVLQYKRVKIPLYKVVKVVNQDVKEDEEMGPTKYRHVFLLDKGNQTLVHFNMEYIKRKDKFRKFVQAVKDENPDVKMEFDHKYMKKLK